MKYRAGVARFLASERASSIVLLPTAALALVLGHWNLLGSLDNSVHFLGIGLTLRGWVEVGPLALFFYMAGVEIRSSLLENKRSAHVPVAITAALFGMLVPAGLYLLGAQIFGLTKSAWGVPMATDLPLALAALTLIRPERFAQLRQFLLLLAIADDLGTIIVIAVKFHEHYRIFDIALLLTTLAGFAMAARLKRTPWQLMVALVITGWVFAVRSGFHPTVVAVAFGLLTPPRYFTPVITRVEPVSSFVAVPLFIFTALGIHIAWPNQSHLQTMIWILALARIIGKPIGILAGIWLAGRFSSSFSMRAIDRLTIGLVGCLGFSVSLLFAQLALTGVEQTSATLAIVLTLPIAALVLGVSFFLTRATAA